jgi:EmrB/QacA subfamily drug resistance transporter
LNDQSTLPSPGLRDWLILAAVSLVQLVVVLDGTIVSIALPQAQLDLGLSNSERAWVVTIYALTFGSLLLLGGLLVNRWGRKATFMIGLVGFGLTSGWGGLVQTGTELVIARALQGVFAALMAPAALAILTTTFSSGPARNVAFAIFGTCAGVGAAVGLLLGGLLTEFVSWRWCLLVNVPIVVIVVLVGAFILPRNEADRSHPIDTLGAALIAAGSGLLVYGFALAEHGFLNVEVWLFVALGLAFVGAFVFLQSRIRFPLLPLAIVRDRVRAAAFIVQGVTGAMMIGAMLYVTLHLQITLGMPAFIAGLATLPQTITVLFVAGIGSRYLDAFGPKPFLMTGLFLSAIALFFLSFITPAGSYWTQVFPALIVSGAGLGMIFMPLQNVALRGVDPHHAGVAGAVATASGQIGGSIGLAVWTAIATAVTGASGDVGLLVAGYSAVFNASAVLMLAAGVFILIALPWKIDMGTADRAAVSVH